MSKQFFSSIDKTVLREIVDDLSDTPNTIAEMFRILFYTDYNSTNYVETVNTGIWLYSFVVFLALDIPFVTIKVITGRIFKRVKQLQRKKYYIIENERRRQIRAERRKIRQRSTLNKCPTPKEFIRAWEGSKTSLAGMLKFGGMVHDLACFVDSSLRFNQSKTKITGRNGGIKAWIRENVPELLPKYQTIMRYHVAAVKIRQHTLINDPMPTALIYDTIEKCQYWSTEEILSHCAKSSTSIIDEMNRSLKVRYLPNKDRIAEFSQKWANKAGFKRDSKDDKQIQKHFNRAINEALKLLREAIEGRVGEYLKQVKATIAEELKASRRKAMKTTKLINGRIKRIKISDTKERTSGIEERKPLSAKIKRWRECKSWLYAVLDKREKMLDEITGKIS